MINGTPSSRVLPIRILVAETDLQLLAEMKRGLERTGHSVIAATDGMMAWDHLVSVTPPDVLVTRFHLGSGKPPGTALGLYARSCHPRIPVVYTPESLDLAEHADHEHGAILVKPFAVRDLVQTVNQLLER
jgi:DNA-binding response OmpR family regulator